MSRFTNKATGVTVSVADHKDDRFGAEWKLADGRASRSRTPKASAAKSDGSPTVADLKAEIERRNLLRYEDAQLPTTGKKADLIALIAEDDADIEAEDGLEDVDEDESDEG